MAAQATRGFDALRAALPARSRERSYRWALGLAGSMLGLNLLLLAWAYQARSLAELLLLSALRALSVALTFIVAHDACHGALAPGSRVNHVLGQLCFLPSWHSFTAWRRRHNHIHHRHTNLLQADNAYPPLSPAEYLAAPRWHRLHYRLSRSISGVWLLYLPELLRWQLGPSRSARTDYAALDRRYPLERGTAGLWCLGEIGLFTGLWSGLGWLPAAGMGQPTLFLGGFVLVHVAWLWLMGFTTFLHHCHPQVCWFGPAQAQVLDPAQRQVHATVHADLGLLHCAMLNIFVHTVHHLDTRIPLYRLRAAQQALEAELGSVVPRWRFGWPGVRRCFAHCKLWDAQAGCWVGYPAALGRARLSR